MKVYLAYFILWLFVSFAMLPVLFDCNNYSDAVKASFAFQFLLSLVVIVGIVLTWALDTVGVF